MNAGKLYRLKRPRGPSFTSRQAILAKPIDGGPVHWIPYDTVCMLINPDYSSDTDYSEASDMLHDYASHVCVLIGDQLFLISHHTLAGATSLEEI
jgi:hypothetical protein